MTSADPLRWIAVAAAAMACEPELPDEPFLCSQEGTCPDGFTCRATVCERDGAATQVSRPVRTTWINSAEMYWFPSALGGATLVVNDGFTPGERALYEIHVNEDGTAEAPRLLLDLAEDYPTSSAVVALDDARYAVLTLRFPSVVEDAQTLTLFEIGRDTPEGEDVAIEQTYSTTLGYLGGTEPAYIGAVSAQSGVEMCFVDPAKGGTFHVRRISNGAVARDLALPLPPTVLPLSADCLLWRSGDEQSGALVVRLGFEAPAVYRVPSDATTGADFIGPEPIDGLAMFPFTESVASLVLEPVDEATSEATLVTTDWSGNQLQSEALGIYPDELEPHTASASPDGVLFAPSSSSSDFATLQISSLTPTGASPMTEIDRAGTDTLYSARAFSNGGVVYLAWTALHGDLMDLWIATAAE